MKAGAIQLTRTPNGESSTAIARVIPLTADFAAVYAMTADEKKAYQNPGY